MSKRRLLFRASPAGPLFAPLLVLAALVSGIALACGGGPGVDAVVAQDPTCGDQPERLMADAGVDADAAPPAGPGPVCATGQ